MSETARLEKIIRRVLQYHAYAQNPSTTIPVFPDHLHIEPTNTCNLRCIHCHQSSRGSFFTKTRGMMDFDLYRRIIDQVRPLSEQITLDSHGEPLNHPRILDMVAYAKTAGLAVNLLTNATRLHSGVTEELIRVGLDRAVFSFEGSTPEVHERVRRRSSYHETLRNILYFMKRNHEEGHRTFVCMSMIKHSQTEADVEPYRNYFGSLACDAVFVSPLLGLSGASPLSDEKTAPRVGTPEEARLCRVPWMNLSVHWDGTVSPCTIDVNESHVIGDLRSETLFEIFNNTPAQSFRRCHLEGDFDWIEQQGPLCASCNIRFDPEYEEYDLRRMEQFAPKHIIRQTSVHLGYKETLSDPAGEAARYEKTALEWEAVGRHLERQTGGGRVIQQESHPQ